MCKKLKLHGFLFCLVLSLWMGVCPKLYGQLTVHFIDVGQADAILVESDGENMLIDGGTGADSSLIYAYLKNHGIATLKYIVNTHPHEDHVGGLPGALNYATVERGFSSHQEYNSQAFRDYKRYLAMQGLELEVLEAGSSLSLGESHIQVLGPLEHDGDINNSSLVLYLVYDEVSFLFTGDMEEGSEYDLLEAGLVPDCTVLKVAHHGSESSSGYRFLRSALPEFAVISVGKNNSYDHPSPKVLSRLEDAGAQIFRTDVHGHVLAHSDGKTVEFSVSRNGSGSTVSGKEVSASVSPQKNTTAQGGSKTTPKEAVSVTYILNINSKKYHLPSCHSASRIKEGNKKEFSGSRQEVLELNYQPCGICKP
ncbi:MAG: MBL fold metallo-hydrolase [Spirochaetaceae bacterium]|nr:MBL fold metallo-hydrolase [Spirochaetaceae bacterium]